jgi:Tfp pilus assembly protein PilZ
MKEKRRSKRIQLDIYVNYSSQASAPVCDLSEHGLCIKTENKFEIGNYIVITFELGDSNKIRAIGKVVRIDDAEQEKKQYGIDFWYIEEKDRSNICGYLNALQNIPEIICE